MAKFWVYTSHLHCGGAILAVNEHLAGLCEKQAER